MSKELSIVNSMMRVINRQRFTVEDLSNAMYAEAHSLMTDKLNELCGEYWWFNTDVTRYNREADKTVTLPNNILSVKVVQDYYSTRTLEDAYQHASVDNFKLSINHSTVLEEESYLVQTSRLVPVNTLPIQASAYLEAYCRMEFYLERDNDPTRLQMLQNIASLKYSMLQQKHNSSMNLNVFNKKYAERFTIAGPQP